MFTRVLHLKTNMNPTILQTLQIISMYYTWQRKSNLRSGRQWCRKIFEEEERNKHGFCSSLLPHMRLTDRELFANFTRMSCSQFDSLLLLVGEKLQKKTTNFRKPISPSDRLSLCLRFLATGGSYADLSYGFRIGKSTVCKIVKETCEVLIQVLKPVYMAVPQNEDEWQAIAVGFNIRWNFPNCVGAIDGKHIAIQAPPDSGSSFVNYKGFHSIVLMAACDAFYCFTFVDVENYGRISDGGVFSGCYLGQQITQPNFLPADSAFPSSEQTVVVPYVFVADEAFPLKDHLLRPFPGHYLDVEKRIFNYRLSRARRCIENAFGILSSRWRVLRTTMALLPENATQVTLACCCLHNFLMKTEQQYANRTYCPVSFADSASENGRINEGSWRENEMLPSVQRQGSNRASNTAIEIREKFKDYFMGDGYVPWQDKM